MTRDQWYSQGGSPGRPDKQVLCYDNGMCFALLACLVVVGGRSVAFREVEVVLVAMPDPNMHYKTMRYTK